MREKTVILKLKKVLYQVIFYELINDLMRHKKRKPERYLYKTF